MLDKAKGFQVNHIGNERVPQKEMRKNASSVCTYERYGSLRRRNRVRTPHCALEGIRRVWLEDVGTYLGYKRE